MGENQQPQLGCTAVVMLRGQTEAETCRLNGWHVGTVLAGDEGYGPETIRITGIGERGLFAKRLTDTTGQSVNCTEAQWTLTCRDWYEV